MHTKQELDKRLNQAGIQPLKKLGQNFLLNPRICEKMTARVAELNPLTVIEIGPGLGAITDELVVDGRKLILVEYDSGLVRYWSSRLLPSQAEVIHEDALKLDWQALCFQAPAVLVSNLPYSIAASLVIELSELKDASKFSSLILMFQKEVAQRITATKNSEDYGMLSVVAQTHWDLSILIDAGPQDFFPVPNVGSRVLEFRPKPVKHDRRAFTTFVKLAFSQRRKKLLSNLSSRYNRADLERAFLTLELGENTRAQELGFEVFQKLFDLLSHGVSGL